MSIDISSGDRYIEGMSKDAKDIFKDCEVYQSLQPKQKLFLLEYLKDFNATRAYIAAGYTGKGSSVSAHETLRKPKIKTALAEIQAVMGNKEDNSVASLVELQQFWTSILRGDIGRVCSWNDGGLSFNSTSEGMPLENRRLIRKISVKEKTSPKGDFTEVQTSVELHDPLKASELLGRSLGGFIDKTEVTGKDGEPIQFSDTERAAKLQLLLLKAARRATESKSAKPS